MKRARPVETVNKGGKKLGSREISRRLMPNVGHVARVGTGTSSHFAQWKRESPTGGWKERKKVEKHLRNMSAVWLAEQLDAKGGAENLAMGRTLRKLAPSYPNMLVVSQAKRVDLLAVPGVGKRGIEKLGEYLLAHNVTLGWDA